MCLKAYQLTLTDEERLLALYPCHGLAARIPHGRFSHKVSFEILVDMAYFLSSEKLYSTSVDYIEISLKIITNFDKNN
jgi:hypothetical protein